MPDFDRHNVDRLFREGLNDVDMPVSNKAWGAIASEMEKDQLRRKVVWARSTAAAAVLLLIALGSWTLFNVGGQNSATTNNANNFAFAKQMQKLENSHGIGFVNCDGPSASPKVQMQAFQLPFIPRKTVLQSDFPSHRSAFLPNPNFKELLKGLNSKPSVGDQQKDAVNNIRETLKARQTFHLASFNTTPQRNPIQASEFFDAVEEAPKRKKEREFTFVLDDSDMKKKPKNRRWELGGAVSPDMMFASTTPVQQGSATTRSASTLPDVATNADTKRLSPVTAFSTGVRTGFEINERLSVRSGLMYTNRQTSASEDVVAYGKTDFLQNNLNLHYIEVPLTMKYNVIHNSNFDYFVSGGVSGNLFLYYDNSLTTSDGAVAARRVSEKSDALTPSQANVLVSTGMQYRLWNRLSMQLEPGLKYGIKTADLAFSQTKPLSMSLLSGISYHF